MKTFLKPTNGFDILTRNIGAHFSLAQRPLSFALLLSAVILCPAFESVVCAQAPIIVNPPQGETVTIGGSVTLSVGVTGAAPSLPSVSTGTLRLWLKGDAGVITNEAGLVSDWQDQSGNGNDASQASTNNQPALVYPAGIEGRPALRFNGVEDGINGTYLHGIGDVGLSNALTAFTLYKAFTATNLASCMWLTGVPGAVYGASRGFTILYGDLDFTTWAYDSETTFAVPTNTYRICTDRVNGSLSSVEIFDATATMETNFTVPISAASTPQPGYYVGGINPGLPYVSPDNLNGDMAEILIYNGSLSDPDRLAVQSYLQQKYLGTGAPTMESYQWEFDGTNISGATNATLTLANVQPSEAGAYSVVVTDLTGSTTSSNAVLNVVPLTLTNGLVAYYPFNGNANDATGNGHDLVNHGATLCADRFGNANQAYNFDGSSNFLGTSVPPLTQVDNWTLTAWMRPAVYPQATGYAVCMGFDDGSEGDGYGMGVSGNGNGNIGFTPGNELWAFFPGLGFIDTGFLFSTNTTTEWYQVVMSRNSGSLEMYVNGEATTNGGPTVYTPLTPTSFEIGSGGSAARFFNGAVDDVRVYNRALSASEVQELYTAEAPVATTVNINMQPQNESVTTGGTATFSVSAAGTSPLEYQWSFDGTNIAGATDSTLILTNVGPGAAGTYGVIVSNTISSTASSNAVLTVGSAPSVTVSPLSESVVQGTNVTFLASATGTSPLSFQWSFDGAEMPQQTNSVLNLTNVQSANGGTYVVTVSSPFGTAVSSNTVLNVAQLPVIGTEPQSQSVLVGSNATFSVSAGSTPSVSSGTLQLWLKADSGVVTNGAGLVTEWQDQSSNTNNAAQANTNYQPLLVYPSGLGGQAAIRFDGVGGNISYLQGTGDVGVPDAMTTFTVVNAFTSTNYVDMAWLIGVPAIVYGADRSETIFEHQRDFTTWAYGFVPPFVVPTNTYRIWSDRIDTNLTTVELFDTSASGSSTNFSSAMPPASTPAAGYYVGGIDPSLQYVAGWKLNGDIAEVIVYRGQLTDVDRLAVQSYLQQKYFGGGGSIGDTFQWQFDGTNIAGATNATLTITNVQGANAGTYTVIITDSAGSVTSSNAILTTLFPATITSSPASQSVSAGTTVTFNADASGTAPLSYQWQFNGTNIVGATNTSFTVTNAVIANAGSYTMVALNPYGLATSAVATLAVDESTVQVVNTTATGAGTVVVSINLIGLGTESGVGFSLNFDPSILTYVGTAVGSGASGSAMQVNTNQALSGHIGLGAAEFTGTFPSGTNDIFDVTFQVAVVTNSTTTSLTFGNSPANEEISDPTAQSLPAVYLPGVVVVSPTSLEGDVSPRPNGDEVLNISDWIQEGRFVAGLDTITNASEFERADCAPRSTLGDGELTVADWVQVGRYAVGLDPLTAAGGPTAPTPSTRQSGHPVKNSDTPALTLVPLTQGGQMNSVSVELASQGEVNSAGFSVTFNPALVHFVSASLASGASGAAFIQNTNPATPGTLGFVVGSLAPATFPAGTAPLVTLNFAPVAFSNTTALAFADLPVACQLADANAQPVSASFVSASLVVGGASWPTLSITPSGNDISLAWPSTGASFTLQAASSLDGAWTNVVVTPTTNGNSVTLTTPVSNNSVYYRLKY